MRNTGTVGFPAQKISNSKKNKKWYTNCIDAGEDLCLGEHALSRDNMIANYNLEDGIIDEGDIDETFNPMGIVGAVFPAKTQNYPIIKPKIDLLIGEEYKRKNDYKVIVTNDDAISDKEEGKKKIVIDFLKSKVTQREDLDKEEFEKELKEIDQYSNYEYQDFREITASRILKYFEKEQNFKLKFNKGFWHELISGKEVYTVEIIAGEPKFRVVDPRSIYPYRNGDSIKIEDSDIITEVQYMSIGTVIDTFYDYLMPSEINDLESANTTTDNNVVNYAASTPNMSSSMNNSEMIETDDINVTNKDNYDQQGNVRVVRVLWKGMKRVGVLSYFDEDSAEPLQDLIEPGYEPNEMKGETVEWLWISEWYEGVKIGGEIYLKYGIRPLQYRRMNNISACSPGYWGNDIGKSLIDVTKSYQYLYNIIMKRTELAFAKYKGSIYSLDVSKVPDGWDMDKWMYYAETMGWAVEDPFKEGNKGAAMGKLSGNMNSTGRVMNPETGNYIQQHIMMLGYIESQVGIISGITAQRQGQVQTRELVGNVERSLTQSSHITEKWFIPHYDVIRRALEGFIETAKHCFAEKTDIRYQYMLDDMSAVMLNINGEEFADADYGVFLENNSNIEQLVSSLKELAHAGIQNGKINFSQLMDIYLSDSVSSIRRKIERNEIESVEREEQQAQAQQQSQEKLVQMEIQDKEADRELERYKIDSDNINDIEVKQMDLDIKSLELEINAESDKDLAAIKDFNEKANLDLKNRQLEETNRSNKEKEKIAKIAKKKQ
jgi:hypothetical protein